MAKKMKNITMLFLINILCFFTVFGYSQTTRICPEKIGDDIPRARFFSLRESDDLTNAKKDLRHTGFVPRGEQAGVL